MDTNTLRSKDAYSKNQDILINTVPKMRMRENEDYETWQKRAYEKLRELLCMEKMEMPESNGFHIEWEREYEEFYETRFTFCSEQDYTVPCHLLIPKNVPAPYKPVICLQGHSTGMHISLGRAKYSEDAECIRNGDRDFAIRAVKEGCAAIAMEQRYMGECGGDENGPGCVHGKALTALLLGRCAIGERVWDVMRLIDVLQENFNQLDMDKLICLGNSGGGTTTFYATCLEPRIKCAVPSCSICTYKDSIAAMRHCCCNYIPHIAEYFDMGDLFGLIAPRKIIVVNGKEDTIFPANGVAETVDIAKNVFRKCGAAENIFLVTGDGGHRFYADNTWSVINNLTNQKSNSATRGK